MDKKAVVIYTVEYIHSSIKEGILTFCDSMDGPGEYFAKSNKCVGGRQTPHDLTYMWNLMNTIN